ncbi:MAG: hypothetical protein KL787_06645 [Taibaiella sp.]|nr:hypothetical protein [Taibaiella sp.]
MHSSNSLRLVLDLEAKLDELVKAYKILSKENEALAKKQSRSQDKVKALEKEKEELEEKIQQLSVQNVVQHEQWDNERLKRYLDDVILLLDKNIKML